MSQTFQNPSEFLQHLQVKLSSDQDIPTEVQIQLLHGSVHAIKYLIDSQSLLSTKFYELMLVLNDADASWAHKLVTIYEIVEAGQVDVTQMHDILKKEICGL